ncbi:BTAD domain-containing putative transcriptional regulator [Streptomyces sp. NBC_00859]|uniref:AfsR/SARP family transcriptional regulator n=1 Tax=Streptomyces sp. NBC_00859 TaxID=2903682 RepID=UPI00386ED7DB|nr:AfsR/SARP family transcriptional regulator [Streptomyces sp. NBC_00859]
MTGDADPAAHAGRADGLARFNVLGALECWAGGKRVHAGGPVAERVLAMLLLETGHVVTVARLVEAAWDGEPPTTAPHQIRKAVASLRSRIPGGKGLFLTDGPGYRAAVRDEQLDVRMFSRWAQEGGRALTDGETAGARALLQDALALWRGPVLAADGGDVIAGVSTSLEERWLTATEQLFRIRLDDGEAAELVGDLKAAVAGHPLRETLRGQLMLALYRSQRQAEALREYDTVRAMLRDELGVDPGPHLKALHRAILREAPEAAAPDPARPSTPPGPAAAVAPAPRASGQGPRTLPSDLGDFTGRQAELSMLLSYATAPEPANGPRVVAVDGMGGSGKTTLAVHAAHLLAGRYPDGQLHIDLRGFSSGEQPLGPADVVSALLGALGVPSGRIPGDAAGRDALWQATLAGRRILLLLDNAADLAQIKPVLPASPGTLTLVTSRGRLIGLDGADWISLGEMTREDSTALIARTLGQDLAGEDPEATAALAGLCGHLPLALRISTARLRNRPRWTVRNLVDRLSDESRRLDELHAGDRGVAANLRLSYQALDQWHRTAFRLLGLHPGARADVHSTAALLRVGTQDADDVLEHLLDMHLLQQHEAGSYAFHDLVGAFARSLRGHGAEAADITAFERLLDFWFRATEEACAVLFPGRAQYPTAARPADVESELPRLDTPELARAWFDRELDSLSAAVRLAHEWGLDRQAVRLARNVVFHLNLRSCTRQFHEVSTVSVAAARTLDDGLGLRMSLSNLAAAQWKSGRLLEGAESAAEAVEVARRIGDRRGEAFSLDLLGLLRMTLGDLGTGRDHLRRSIAIHVDTGNAGQEAIALCNLSTVSTWLGDLEEAVRAAERARAIYRRLGDRENEVAALNDLAIAHLQTGDPHAARRCVAQADPTEAPERTGGERGAADESSMPEHLALTLVIAADIHHRLGDAEGADSRLDRALELASSRGTPIRRATIENIAGFIHLRRGEPEAALALHRHAHRSSESIGYRFEQARALTGMAAASAVLGGGERATEYRRLADELFDRMRVPAAARPSAGA